MDDLSTHTSERKHFFTRIPVNSKEILRWSWPVHINILQEDRTLADQLLQGHWTSQFSKIHTQQEFNGEGILFHPEGWASFQNAIQDYNWKRHQGIALILEGRDFFSAEYPDPGVLVPAEELIRDGDLSGVLIVERPDDLIGWFNYLFELLSHNLNILDVLEQCVGCAYFIYDPKLEEETRLTSVFNGIIAGLRKPYAFRPDETFFIRSRITGEQSFTPVELADFIEQYLPQFRFDHESGEASGLREMTETLYDIQGEGIFNTHVKNYIEYMSGPPDAILESSGAGVEEEDMLGEEEEMEESGSEMAGDPDSSDDEIAGPSRRRRKPTARKRAARKSAKKSRARNGDRDAAEAQPRYLQGKICDPADKNKDKLDFVRPDTDYDFYVRIAAYDSEWVVATERMSTEVVFRDSEEEEEPLTLKLVTGEDDPIQEKTVMLPRQGNTNEKKFNLSTKGKKEVLKAKLFIYHYERLIQLAELTCTIVPKGKSTDVPKTSLAILFSLSTDKESLEASKRYALSFHVASSNEGTQMVSSAKTDKTTLRSSQGLKKLVDDIKTLIEMAAKDIDEYPEDLTAESNVGLLRMLAIKGNDLYVNYLRKNAAEGPVQIVAFEQEFVPLDYVYTLPAPAPDAALCDHAEEALRKGKCQQCHLFNDTPADHLCPFGFWGLSREIERFRYDADASLTAGDFAFSVGAATVRPLLPVLQHTLHASTTKTEAKKKGLRKKVFETIKKNSPSSNWAKSWLDWKNFVGKKTYPETLLLIVHTEKDPNLDALQVEIEKGDFLVKNYITKNQISITDAIKPIVVVIGCSTADVGDQSFDISNQFLNNGAAIVISNFTKIRGSQAGQILIRLVELLKETAKKESSLGSVMLRLRQQLLAEGLMVSLSVITHGDANWKIKS